MASRILDAGALPHAVLDSCHKPTQRRGGLNGPSRKVSRWRRGCAGAPREGKAAVMVVWEVGGYRGYMERVHGWIYRRFGERAERMVWLCVGIGIGPRARQSEFLNWESEP